MTASSAITKLALKGDTGYTPVKGVDYFDGDPGTPGDASAAWPVGAIFISAVATNPHELFGFGTWSKVGAGRVLVGQDTGDTAFDTLGETGGAKTVQSSAQTFTGTQGTTSANSGSAVKVGTSSSNAAPASHTHTLTPAGTNTPGAATSVVQPYLVVNFWQRTA